MHFLIFGLAMMAAQPSGEDQQAAPAEADAAQATQPAETAGKSEHVRASDTERTELAGETRTNEKVLCRREKATGSRLSGKKVCLTEREWEARRQEARQAVEKGQNQRTYSGG